MDEFPVAGPEIAIIAPATGVSGPPILNTGSEVSCARALVPIAAPEASVSWLGTHVGAGGGRCGRTYDGNLRSADGYLSAGDRCLGAGDTYFCGGGRCFDAGDTCFTGGDRQGRSGVRCLRPPEAKEIWIVPPKMEIRRFSARRRKRHARGVPSPTPQRRRVSTLEIGFWRSD